MLCLQLFTFHCCTIQNNPLDIIHVICWLGVVSFNSWHIIIAYHNHKWWYCLWLNRLPWHKQKVRQAQSDLMEVMWLKYDATSNQMLPITWSLKSNHPYYSWCYLLNLSYISWLMVYDVDDEFARMSISPFYSHKLSNWRVVMRFHLFYSINMNDKWLLCAAFACGYPLLTATRSIRFGCIVSWEQVSQGTTPNVVSSCVRSWAVTLNTNQQYIYI